MNEIQRILDVLNTLRIPPQPEEYEIHEEIARALDAAGISYIHECKLLPGRRIDFACGRIGIEVKKSRPIAAKLREQLKRYLEETELESIIVVMQKPCILHRTLCNKPVYVVALNRLWGVALH